MDSIDEMTGGAVIGGYVPYHDFEAAVPEALKDEIDQLRQDIIDGVVVPGP